MSITFCTTYYDPEQKRQGSLEVSAKKFGVKIHNFGYASHFRGFLKTKLIPLKKFVDSCKTDLVCFLDGNDTIMTAPPDDIVETYNKISKGKVVIGSEIENWPYKELEEQMRAYSRARGSTGRYAFVDTGLILGNSQALSKTLDAVIRSVTVYKASMPHVSESIIEDDVGLFILNILDGKIDPVIDYDCKIICPIRNLPKEAYSIKGGKLHLEGGVQPHIVHCNGGGRKDRNRMRGASVALLKKRAHKLVKVKPCKGYPCLRVAMDTPEKQGWFNPSIMLYNGETMVAWRKDQPPWCSGNSEIWVRRKADAPPMRLLTGAEDPKLFTHKGKACFSYTTSKPDKVWQIGMVTLTEDGQVEKNHIFAYGNEKEKNWLFFEHEGTLYCVYHMSPWRVLKYDDFSAEMDPAFQCNAIKWSYGEIRGNTPPLLVGDRSYSFFHSSRIVNQVSVHELASPRRAYYHGCVEFSAEPPFKPLRWTKQPLIWPTSPNEVGMFVGGAIYEHDTWTLSAGIQERWSSLFVISHETLLKELDGNQPRAGSFPQP